MLGIYCRISKDKPEGKDRSIEDQKYHGIELSKKLGIDYQVFIDEGISGTKSIEERPGLSELIDCIYDGSITKIFVYDQSRLERSIEARMALNKVFNDEQIEVYTESGLVGKDIESEFAGDIMSVINNYYVKITAKKIKSALLRNAVNGKAHGILAYGLGKDENGIIVIDSNESLIVRDIFELSLEGIGTKKIADILNSRGVPTRYNKIGKGTLTTSDHLSKIKRTISKSDITWSGNTIRNILVNPIYKGERRFAGGTYKVPAIFSESYWQKVQDNLTRNRTYSGKVNKYNYLLRGKIICGVCERNYYGRKRVKNSDNFYMCSSKRNPSKNCGNKGINIDLMEDFIWQRFFADEVLIYRIKEYLNKTDLKEKLISIDDSLKSVQKKLSRIKLEKKNTRSFMVKGIFDEAGGYETLKELEIESEKYLRELDDFNKKKESLVNLIENNSKLTDNLFEIRKSTDFNTKREIINEYINRIIIKSLDDSLYLFVVQFKIEGLDEEIFIYNRKMKLAHELSKDILIGLNLKNKFIIDVGRTSGKLLREHKKLIEKLGKIIAH